MEYSLWGRLMDAMGWILLTRSIDLARERFHETADKIDVNSKALEKLFVRYFMQR